VRVLGIDASTRQIAWAVVDGPRKSDLVGCGELVFEKGLSHSERRRAAAARVMTLMDNDPDVVVMERLRLFSNRKISFDVIVRLTALWTMVADASSAPVWTVASNAWRRLAHGSGRTDKAYSVAWARRYGISKSKLTHDLADALGIAVAGTRMLDDGERRLFQLWD